MTNQFDVVEAAEQELERQREALETVKAKRDDFANRHAQAVAEAAGMTGRLVAGEEGITPKHAADSRTAAKEIADALAVLDSEILARTGVVRQAELNLLGAKVNAGAGGLLTAEQVAAKIALAREQVDEILFALADDLQEHNEYLESLYVAVKEATPTGGGAGKVPGVSLPNSDPYNHSIRSNRGTFSPVSVSVRMAEPANGSYYRWKDDQQPNPGKPVQLDGQ